MFLERNRSVLPLVLLLCSRCFCTTAVFVFAPGQIVAGTDRLASDLSPAGTLTNQQFSTKIVLLNKRFIVACIGLEKSHSGSILVYDFPEWINRVEVQMTPTTSALQLAAIVEKESSHTLTETVPIEKMMKDGRLKHSKELDSLLVQYIIAAFDNGLPTIIQVYYKFDWAGKHLIGPTQEVEIPDDKGTNIGVYTSGRTCGISNITDPSTYGYKSMTILAPTAFKKMIALHATLPDEGIQAARAMIDTEANAEPTYVGKGSTIILLPVTGDGTVTEYDKQKTRLKKEAAAEAARCSQLGR